MKLLFRIDLGDEQDPDPIVLEGPEPRGKAGGMIRAVREKLINLYPGNGGRIRVFLNEVPIQCQRTLGEQGVVDGSLLTVCWWWSEQQLKKTNCLTHEERRQEYKKKKKHKRVRDPVRREKGTTEEELASFGFVQNPSHSRNRERSPSEGPPHNDRYKLYRSLTGAPIATYLFKKSYPEEARMLILGAEAAISLGVNREQIQMHKELDVRSGECKVHVTVVPPRDAGI